MDIKDQVTKIVDKVKNDKDFEKEFKSNPEKAIEKVSGIDIPDGMLDKVVSGVQAKLCAGKAADALGSLKKMI
ncbi:MAG: hypothetical protein IJ054_04620 [Lachnospiraceae bacterium]|nr:hypothetical protein [Lachnospiraceae bacterium]